MNKRNRFWRRIVVLAIASMILAVFAPTIQAQDAVATATMDDVTHLQIGIDSTWVLIASMLVFFMQAGFAMLEAGFIQHTGVVNALLENFMDAGLTALVFWAVGFGLAFGTSANGLIGTDNFFLSKAFTFENGTIQYAMVDGLNISVLTFFFFQFAFAATASTIATGGMAERTDFIGDIIYSAIVGAIIYPIVVHWVWGGGWLAQNGFHDFAGSTVVHTVGGVTALLGAILLGPRVGRVFGSPPRPHNLGLATLGTMILWFGWYGFNPGSSLGMGNDGVVGLVTLNTTLAAAAGTMSAMFLLFARTGKWDLGFTLNGSLAGLVAITAGCAFVAPWAAIVIGLVAGVLVVLVVDLLEKLKIDDPVGAFAVHGACGIFGTLAIGLFGQAELTLTGQAGLLVGGGFDLFIAQFIGSAATVIFVGLSAVVMFTALKAVKRLRVHPEADAVGIDVYEHAASLWPDILPVGEGAPTSEGSPKLSTAPAAGD
ncbi:MAG: ammonium transporter [Anaerolineaceae bacterium]|nr:ammonium transporter [Anaerolineaceae bacterium]